MIFTDTRTYADYEEYTAPRAQRARQLWGEIEALKAAGQPHDELTRERNAVIAECDEAEDRMERARRRFEEDQPRDEHPS